MADIQGPFVDLRTFVNGNISDVNLSSSAAIAETKLAVGSSGLAKGAFRAFRTAAHTLATGGVIVYDTDTGAGFDVSGWFDTTTGIFTPQVAGYYRFSWSVMSSGAFTAGSLLGSTLQKNGTDAAAGGRFMQSGTSAPNSVGTDIQVANGTTDNFKVTVVHTNGGLMTVQTGAANTYFSGELIGRA